MGNDLKERVPRAGCLRCDMNWQWEGKAPLSEKSVAERQTDRRMAVWTQPSVLLPAPTGEYPAHERTPSVDDVHRANKQTNPVLLRDHLVKD